RESRLGPASGEHLHRRGALGVLDHVIDRCGKSIDARARDDDGVAAAVGFLGNAQEFAPVVLTELDVKILAFDLQLPGLDEIIHFCKKPRSLGRSAWKREADFLAEKVSGNCRSRSDFRATL